MAMILSVGGGPVSQWGTLSTVECRDQRGFRGRRLMGSGSSLQAVRLGGMKTGAPIWAFSKRGRVVRAEQLEVTTAAAPLSTELNVGGVTEVDKDTFWPIVKSAGEKVVVLDMYTQWCGPCKLMLPKIITLAEGMDDVIFLKLDCNQHNKVLAKELGIRVVPTFKIFKKNELAGEVSGAKYPDLVKAIENARKS
ncbi:unnamed protein product [Calypogeia fissa]